jgi:hydrogenase maturation protein HypF
MALAHLADAATTTVGLEKRVPAEKLRVTRLMLERGFNAPLTSSAGRLFDAVASLIGLRDRVSYEGQAAIELEWLAARNAVDGSYPFDLNESVSDNPSRRELIVDTRPLIRAVAGDASQGIDPAAIARRFHATMVEVIAAVCDRLRRLNGLDAVVLSGGVFLNALLTTETCARLRHDGFRVFRHRLVPPNDGGLSLGQLAIAAAIGQDSAVVR